MLTTVGLLIAPSAFHRIAERGETTGLIHSLAGWFFATTALGPFAVALGVDLEITLERVWGQVPASVLGGIAIAGSAAAGWYGLGLLMRRTQGATERGEALSERHQREPTPLHARIDQMLTEARVILRGAQALLGFQLVIVLTNTFEKLPNTSRSIHGFALLAVALAVVLLITPAALHRIVWAGEESSTLLTIGGRITAISLLPLAVGMTGDAYVVLERIARVPGVAALAAGVMLLFLLGCWFVWPLADLFIGRRNAAGAD